KFREAANAVKTLRDELNKFDPDLAAQLQAAKTSLQTTTDALNVTSKAKATATGLLKQASEKQRQFAKVGVGVKCSRCGQEVTAKHAKDERNRLVAEIKALEEKERELANKDKTEAKA